jgi:hypothetical protein
MADPGESADTILIRFHWPTQYALRKYQRQYSVFYASVYYPCQTTQNDAAVEFNPHKRLNWALDFNIDPMSSVWARPRIGFIANFQRREPKSLIGPRDGLTVRGHYLLRWILAMSPLRVHQVNRYRCKHRVTRTQQHATFQPIMWKSLGKTPVERVY